MDALGTQTLSVLLRDAHIFGGSPHRACKVVGAFHGWAVGQVRVEILGV